MNVILTRMEGSKRLRHGGEIRKEDSYPIVEAPDVWAIDSKTDFYDSGTGYDFNLVTGSSQTCGRHPT